MNTRTQKPVPEIVLLKEVLERASLAVRRGANPVVVFQQDINTTARPTQDSRVIVPNQRYYKERERWNYNAPLLWGYELIERLMADNYEVAVVKIVDVSDSDTHPKRREVNVVLMKFKP